MTDQEKRPDPRSERRAELLEAGKTMPRVMEALAVFEAASLRAPYVPPAPPLVRFSTGANG